MTSVVPTSCLRFVIRSGLQPARDLLSLGRPIRIWVPHPAIFCVKSQDILYSLSRDILYSFWHDASDGEAEAGSAGEQPAEE